MPKESEPAVPEETTSSVSAGSREGNTQDFGSGEGAYPLTCSHGYPSLSGDHEDPRCGPSLEKKTARV